MQMMPGIYYLALMFCETDIDILIRSNLKIFPDTANPKLGKFILFTSKIYGLVGKVL